MRLLDSGEYSPRFVDLVVRDPSTMCLISLVVAFAIVLCLLLGQRQRLAALERVSMLDPLTGLMSGPYFDAERWPALVGRSSAPLAALVIDLDHLKPINDGCGHVAGDRYIAQAAAVIRGATRRGVDHVVRLHTAGDEFLIALSCSTEAQAETIANKVLGQLREAKISASIGVAFTARVSHEERAQLRARAERAMREAKRRGRGRIVLDEAPAPVEPGPAIPQPISDTAATTRRISSGVPKLIAERTRPYSVEPSALFSASGGA
jgi:diguanylate cyclase (GGDEF)-like protein